MEKPTATSPGFFCKNNGKKAFSEFKLVILPTLRANKRVASSRIFRVADSQPDCPPPPPHRSRVKWVDDAQRNGTTNAALTMTMAGGRIYIWNVEGERGAEAAPPDLRHSPRFLHTHTHTPQTQQTIAALFSFFIFSPFLSDRPSRLRQARISFSFFQSDHSARAHAWASRSVSLAPLPPGLPLVERTVVLSLALSQPLVVHLSHSLSHSLSLTRFFFFFCF